MKDINYIRYDKALTDKEILIFSHIVDKFKNHLIDFNTLKNMFLKYDITIEPIPVDISKKMMTVSESDAFKKRISEQKFIYSDIKYFVLNSKDFKNVVFCLDYKAIEVLANYGVSEYQEIMISILTTQLKNSYDKDENLKIERSKWKRRILELRRQLSLNESDKVNKL